jgi:hypothetical protein
MHWEINLETRFDTVAAARLHIFWACILSAARKASFAYL